MTLGNKMQKISALALACALGLSGCAYTETRQAIDQRSDRTQNLLSRASLPAPEKPRESLEVTDHVFLGQNAVKLRNGVPLPPQWESDRGVLLSSPQVSTSLAEAGAIITQNTHIPVRLINGANTPLESDLNATLEPYPGLTYEGPLSGLLDILGGHFGVRWEYDGSTITFSRFETRTFVLTALPEETIESTLSIEADNNGERSAESTITIEYFENLTETLAALLNGEGTATVNRSSGTVTVVTTPDRMAVVSKYMEGEIARTAQQVAFEVTVYSVLLNDNHRYGIQWDDLIVDWADFPINFASGGLPFESATTSQFSGVITNDGRLNGSTLLGNFLSELGEVARVRKVPMVTINNRPASRSLTINRRYISQVETTTTDSTVESSAQTDELEYGMVLQLLPRIMDNGDILVQFAIEDSVLQDLQERTIGSGFIQLPITEVGLYQQQVMMKSGSTLVVGALDDESLQTNANGVGDPDFWGLGGGNETTRGRSMTVLAIKPTEINIRRQSRDGGADDIASSAVSAAD